MTTRRAQPALAVSGLRVAHGQVEAVRDLDLEVHEGQVLAVLGNNGAGKTSTLTAIAGLLPARVRQLEIFGRTLTGLRADERVAAGLSLVPEGRRVFRSVSVRDHLVLGASTRRVRGREVRERLIGEQLERFPVLRRRSSAPAGALSGGEQQQLALARALMARPRVLLLDEPSLGLAPAMIDVVFDAIAKIRAEGSTIVLVEQNARRALEVADDVVVLAQGTATFTGSAEALRKSGVLEELYLGPLAREGT